MRALTAAAPVRTTALCLDDRGEDVIEDTNHERAHLGLPKLEADARLQAAAQRHAEDMARHDVMSHEGSDKSLVTDRADRAGYNWSTISENVAAGFPDAHAVMKGWMNSPGHRSNILDPTVRHIGVGFAYRTDTQLHWYWVQVFGQTKGPTARMDRC